MENHDLHHEFPQYEDKIHTLKVSNNHFKKLFDEYHTTNKEIHRVETSGVYTDSELTELRSRRLNLKDQLFDMLKN